MIGNFRNIYAKLFIRILSSASLPNIAQGFAKPHEIPNFYKTKQNKKPDYLIYSSIVAFPLI